jgi:hypothetical protein
MLPWISWSFLGILNVVGAFAIGRPEKQCAGRSLVKVGGTGFAVGEVENLELIHRPHPGIVHVFAWR